MSVADAFPRVAGLCPGCGGNSLFVANGGHVTCARLDCPDPCAADRVLHDGETEHTVVITEASFNLQHPLRERGEDLFTCDMHSRLSALDGPPAVPGRYRVTHDGERFHWTPIDNAGRAPADGGER